MNKSSRMADLLAITSRLMACLEREVELLRTLKPKELRALQQDKVTLADAYRAFVLALKEPDTSADAVTDLLKGELVEATERFHATLQDNLRALRAMRDVSERVMRAVVQALEEPRLQVTGYNQRGALRRNRRQAAVGPAAVQQRA
ncbi:MAG TPA: hypothetical protein VGF43_10655 [Dongiaceae bacterium]|jgi:hypothetical protein